MAYGRSASAGAALGGCDVGMMAQAVPPKEPELRAIIGRIEALLARLNDVRAMAANTVDNVFGASPEKCAENKMAPHPDSSIGLIHARLDFAGEIMIEIENRVSRLASL